MLLAALAPPVLLAQARTATATLAPLPTASPESVGFAPGGLDTMDEGTLALVDKKHLAGIVTLVAKHGKVVRHKAYGVQSLETNPPMRTDTIARIYSMTKPAAGVAMMVLHEEGKWQPSDPIAKHIPEFANPKVYAGDKDGQPILEAPVLTSNSGIGQACCSPAQDFGDDFAVVLDPDVAKRQVGLTEQYFPLDESWAWQVRLSGSDDLPWKFDISAHYQLQEAMLNQRTNNYNLPNFGSLALRVEEFGVSSSEQMRGNLNLRIARSFGRGNEMLRLSAEILNATNDSAADAYAVTAGPSFGRMTTISTPIIARIGMTYSF